MEGTKPIVIAHRGACGYAPEHTLVAKALSYAMGADFIEQDIVLTRDDQPIVLHDVHLDRVTDVARLFPGRARADGRYYAIDFVFEEIRQLKVHERVDWSSDKVVYPNRFPIGWSDFRVPTLAEEIELIQGLNASTGGNVGIYPEIKSPGWHHQEGKDISRIVLQVLDHYGYHDKSDPIYLQCFEVDETRRLREQLGCQLRLIQLVGNNDWDEGSGKFAHMYTQEGFRELADVIDGIGPSLSQIISGRSEDGELLCSNLVRDAHDLGLVVHPYTLRSDDLPEYVSDFDQLLKILFVHIGVDGAFTDFPDQTVVYLRNLT